jgi:hypothetical protein
MNGGAIKRRLPTNVCRYPHCNKDASWAVYDRGGSYAGVFCLEHADKKIASLAAYHAEIDHVINSGVV